MKYIQPGDFGRGVHEPDHNTPQLPEHPTPRPDDSSEEQKTGQTDSDPKTSQWQRNSDLTPEAWQQQMDQQLQQEESEQQAEARGNLSHLQQSSEKSTVVFRDSKTMIIKNVKPTTTIESILKALDPFAYLDERNVRLVKGKTPGSKCFCFVDMDSHQQVKRLVELLTKPNPLYVDGVRVYAEIARPLKNQNARRDLDKPNTSILGVPPEGSIIGPQQYPPIPQFLQPPMSIQPGIPGGLMAASTNPILSADLSIGQGVGYTGSQAVDPSLQIDGAQMPAEAAGIPADLDALQNYVYGSEIPDTSSYLYDSTSGFYYDPETTLYYDPNSRYFYNAQSQEYLYWDSASKAYVPVPGGSSIVTQPVAMTAADQAILSNPAADAPLDMRNSLVPPDTEASPAAVPGSASDAGLSSAADKKDDDDPAKKDKEEKPRSLAAVKIMKDMERWAKIQNQKKEIVRAASPVLKGGTDDDKQSKSADAGFAVFERKISGAEDLFKKPLAPAKKDEKSKRLMGSLGLLASDYAAGSDEEVEEDKEEANKSSQPSQTEEKDNRLTDWKKMACLLCRRQFPNKDALIRHQQLSDLHRQNMEIHLKIKQSKKELEALENQEKELTARESTRSPEQKRRKHHHQQSQQHKNWAGSSRETNKGIGDRPGLGAEPAPRKKEPVVWDHNTYKQAVRKAMFARFKELE
ncbi:RNA-binding protein 5 isoform X2 [Takifugu rubripes]|nr:RNA-binding protein 5-like isoform X2 [Takifugu rubripes]